MAILEDEILALQDVLLLSRRADVSLFGPFFLLCLPICHKFLQLKACWLSSHVQILPFERREIAETTSTLSPLLHALRTFVIFMSWYVASLTANTIYLSLTNYISFPINAGTDVQTKCMKCVRRAIHDLAAYKAQMETLGDSEVFLLRRYMATHCQIMFYECLLAMGVHTLVNGLCDCIHYGSNRVSSNPDDIVTVRHGSDAMDHFAVLGEQLLEEIYLRQNFLRDNSGDHTTLSFLSDRYRDLQDRFHAVLKRLGPGEVLISRETITRGYKLEFDVAKSRQERMASCSSEHTRVRF